MQLQNHSELVGYALMRAAHVVDERFADAAAVPVLAQILARVDYILDEETIQSLRRGAGQDFLDNEHDRFVYLRPDPLAISSVQADKDLRTSAVIEAMAGTVDDARSWISDEREQRQKDGEEQLLYFVEDIRIPEQFRRTLLEVYPDGNERTSADMTDPGGFAELETVPQDALSES
jgi:hypothetical protein